MCSDFLSGDCPGFGQQGKGFWSSLDGARFDASRSVAHALFGNQHEQPAELLVTVLAMIPRHPDLQGVFEA